MWNVACKMPRYLFHKKDNVRNSVNWKIFLRIESLVYGLLITETTPKLARALFFIDILNH